MSIKNVSSNVNSIPELAPQWKKLNLREILKKKAAFVSISQNKGLYTSEGGLGHERHYERGSLEATIRTVEAARKRDNFVSYNWIGYNIYRHDYPQSVFDQAQYSTWVENIDVSEDKIRFDNELADELQQVVQPGDNHFFEQALQSAFFGTQLPLELQRKQVEVIVFTGVHLDWCVEGNVRIARDNGYLPIVIGDATGCELEEQEPAAFERINNIFAPVLSSEQFVSLLNDEE